ncbi:MAG: HEAT repeat domain-containing protein, partial [Planctomycetes bacterium]|nr:HEAT repeat domain-containing protein [Planctomycetota bacterium]
ALVGQGEFSKVMDLESLVSMAITSSWAITIDLYEAEPEEDRRLYLEDERRAGPAEESRIEGYFWAVAQADPTVREAGVQGLVEAGAPVLSRVRERLAGSSGAEKEALEKVVAGIEAQDSRRERREVVRSLAKAYLGKDRALFARLRRQRKLEVGVLEEILADAGEGLAARRLAAKALADIRTEDGLAAARELVASGELLPGAMVAAALVDAGFVVRRDALVRFLKAPDPMVRGLAILSLPPTADATGDLVDALADADERVRLHAAARLARTQDRRAQDVVIAGRESGDPRSRRLSIRALVQLGQGVGAPHPSVASALTRSLQDDDPIVRRDAAIALGELRIQSAGPSLIGRLEQEHRQDVKVQVILALTNLADREAVKVLKPVLFDTKQDPVIRGASFFYFFRNNLLDGEVAMGMMQLFRPEEDWVIRVVALVVMGMEVPKYPMLAPLLMPHLDAEDPRVRGGAAAGLTRIANSPAANIGEALFKRLQDSHEFVRGAAAGALVYRFAHGLETENETFRTLVETDAAVRRGASAAYYRISVWRGYTPGATPVEQAENKVRYLERAMELRPDERDYPLLLAQILAGPGGLGRYDEALVWIDRAVGAIPDDSELLAWRAFVRIMLGRPKEAAGDLEKMVAEENPPSWAWRLLGEARSRAEEPEVAADAMRTFWLLEPGNLDGQRVVAEALLKAKRYVPLLDMMDDACYRWPEQGYLHWLRARTAAGLGQVEVALAALRDAKAVGCPDLAQSREAPEFAGLVGRPELDSIHR